MVKGDRMKKIIDWLKNNKLLAAIIGIVLLIGIIVLVVFLITKKDEPTEEKNLREETYTMFVKINPLVKLTFKETYYECQKSDGTKDICSEVTNEVISYDLINNDAKEIYNDIDFKGMDVIESLIKLCDVARDNEIGFKSLEITTNRNLDWKELEEGIKNGSKYNEYYEINVDFEEYLNEQEIINKEILENTDIVSFKVKFDSNGGSKVTEQVVVENDTARKPADPSKKGYEFIEWQLNGKKYDFDRKVTKDITLKAKWKKVASEQKPEEQPKPNEEKPTTKPEEPDDGITSTLNKINLNENILVTEVNRANGDASTYVFSDNISTVLASYYSYGRYNPPSFTDEYREASDSRKKEMEAEFAAKLGQLTYNSSKAKKASSEIKSYLQNKMGIKDIKVYEDPKDFGYSYGYLYIHNESSLGKFGESFNEYFYDISSELETIMENNGVACIEGGGLGGGAEPTLLTEALCKEYNLTCARW